MDERGIDKEIVEFVLRNGQIQDDKGDEQRVYQAIVIMELKYDKENDILYIRFNNHKIEESEEIEDRIILDYSNDGLLVGIEVLDATQSDFQFENFIDFKKATSLSA